MNKLEFQRRLDEVETLIADGNYAEAVNECDRLNLDLLDQPRVLQNIAKAYEKCRRYADAEDLLLMAREIAPKSRGILFHLCSVSIKAGEMEEAHRYYDEFEKRAKYDTQRFVLQYRIARAENQPDSELIRILSELRKEEPDDRWMFELARLQAKNGMLEESRQTCEDIDLWFNSGKYVSMAQELHAQLLGEAYSAEEDAAAAAEDTSAGEDSGPLPELIVPLPGIPSQKKPEVKEEAPEEDGFDEDSAAEDASKAFSGDEYESILRQETREIPSVRITSESEEIPPIEFDFTDIAEAIDEVQAQKKTRREEEAVFEEVSFDRERDILEYGNTVAYKPEDEEDREGFRKAETVIVRRRDEKEELIEAETPEEAAELLEEEDEEEQPDPAREAALQALRDKEERSARPEDWRRIVFGEDSVTDSGAEEKDTEEHVVFSVTRDSGTAVNPDTGMLPITEEEDDREIANPIVIDFPEEVASAPAENKAEEVLQEGAASESAEPESAEGAQEENAPLESISQETENAFAAAVQAGAAAAETVKEEAKKDKPFDPQITFEEDKETRENRKSFRESAQEQIDALVNDLDEPIEEQDDVSFIVNEIAKRKKDELLFGNLPIDPDVDEHIWHFIVYGETNTLTLDCAREHMKEISEVIPNCPGRMLKISSDRIGNANIINSIDRFLGSMVVVEQAASLSDQQLRDFAKILDKDDRSLLVIFTDTRDDIIEMFRRVPALKDSFTAIFEGKIYNARDLVNAAKEYLYSQGAKFAREADPVVYEKARMLLGTGQGYYKSEMRDYAEKALKQAEKGGLLGLGGGKVDRDGYLIVTEKHLKKAERR